MQIFLHLVIFNHFAVGWIPAASGIYRSILCSLDLPWESTREGTLLIYGSQFDLFFCIFLPINFYQIQIQIVLANTKYIQFGFLPKFVGFFLFLVELFAISEFFWICSWNCVDFVQYFGFVPEKFQICFWKFGIFSSYNHQLRFVSRSIILRPLCFCINRVDTDFGIRLLWIWPE